MNNYREQFRLHGINDIHAKQIENMVLSKVIDKYFSPDENYPTNPVAFYKEWQKERLLGSYNYELRIAGRKDYLIAADGKKVQPETIIAEIRQEVAASMSMILGALPTIRDAYTEVINLKKFTVSDEMAVNKATEMLHEGYYAADIFSCTNDALRVRHPDMRLEERVDKSVRILQQAEDRFYNSNISANSLALEFYNSMKGSVKKMETLRNFTNSMKEAISKVFSVQDNNHRRR